MAFKIFVGFDSDKHVQVADEPAVGVGISLPGDEFELSLFHIKKKLLVFAVIFALILAFVACDNGNKQPNNRKTKPQPLPICLQKRFDNPFPIY